MNEIDYYQSPCLIYCLTVVGNLALNNLSHSYHITHFLNQAFVAVCETGLSQIWRKRHDIRRHKHEITFTRKDKSASYRSIFRVLSTLTRYFGIELPQNGRDYRRLHHHFHIEGWNLYHKVLSKDLKKKSTTLDEIIFLKNQIE